MIICDLNLRTQIVSWLLHVYIVLPDLSDSKKVGYLVSTVVLGYGLDSSNIFSSFLKSPAHFWDPHRLLIIGN